MRNGMSGSPLLIARSTSRRTWPESDRKSTRLNSSHLGISYAVFCLKKKNHKHQARSKRKYKNAKTNPQNTQKNLHQPSQNTTQHSCSHKRTNNTTNEAQSDSRPAETL